MTNFGKSPPNGRRAAPRTQAPLIVELSIGAMKHSATLLEISRTGAKLSGVDSLAEGEQVELRAGSVQAPGEVVWSKGSEFAIAFDLPLAPAEVSRLRSLVNFVASVSAK
jgi:hypothetical protein